MIRPVKLTDAEQLANIYNYYILNSIATFEEEIISDEEMAKRIQKITKKYPFIVFEENDKILGYAYGSEFHTRVAYNKTVESSVYLREQQKGKGLGSRLYDELIYQLREMEFHSVVVLVSLPNEASVALHEKFKFKKVAELEQVGYKFAKWINVGYWQLILD